MTELELVVLVDESGLPVGQVEKRRVHGTDTPLHLAFSGYLFDSNDRLLVTRRALTKQTWPGVWTNSCCGHPGPGESVVDAFVRRAEQELGLEILDAEIMLRDFRYRATDQTGVVENEFCPVIVATSTTYRPRLNPEEVDAAVWISWSEYRRIASVAPALLSPWTVAQIGELERQGIEMGAERSNLSEGCAAQEPHHRDLA